LTPGRATGLVVLIQTRSDFVPELLRDDPVVLTGEMLIAVDDLSEIDAIAKQMV
jgi:hypothetical protein